MEDLTPDDRIDMEYTREIFERLANSDPAAEPDLNDEFDEERARLAVPTDWQWHVKLQHLDRKALYRHQIVQHEKKLQRLNSNPRSDPDEIAETAKKLELFNKFFEASQEVEDELLADINGLLGPPKE